MQSLGGILTTAGLMGTMASIGYMNSIEYVAPPFPAGYLAGIIAIVLGAALLLSSSLVAIEERKSNNLPQWIVMAILAAGLVGYGVWETQVHPLELPLCPCNTDYYGKDCLPCPNDIQGVCHGRGFCDDGNEGSGVCFCDNGWTGENCDRCADTFQGDQCDTCKRGWTGDKCDRCYPGYAGSRCDYCDTNWITESDAIGTVCRYCEPGAWGGYCKPCSDCTAHDPFAVCKDNDWHNDNMYNPLACTPAGSTCTDKYECDSFNCKGICVLGDETTGQVCEFDGDCFPGECQYKQCCVEQRHGDGTCDCGAVGFFGPLCEKCPGFDGIYSNTICTGHGTCAAQYADKEYVGLACECVPEGNTPFPAWTGETCSCLKTTPLDESCSECATGSFGPQCQSCPGGSGIGQCNMHGKCGDGVSGNGLCTCDIDIKTGGLGAFSGDACDACFSGDFYSNQCKPCPNLQLVQCDQEGFLAELPGVNQCIQSCGFKTCNTNNGFCH